ncbi:MAG: pyruvate dehydrogenase (acetyl-transferring) E1 component subunit alpha [Gammaproteobacteria bacterium]
MKTVAKFEIKLTQYLDPEGKTTTKQLPAFAKNADELIEMYKMMSFVRVFDTKAIALQRTGQLGTYASCLGHEATHVGIGMAMQEDDVFCPMYREYGAQFVRGVKPHEVLLFWGGDERGNNFSGPAQDFPWCVPIATQFHHATGAAMALKYFNRKAAAVAVIGDGGTSQGDFYESLNAAGVWDLPCVFVIANNQWAISVPLEIQTRCQTLAQKGIAGGIHCEQVDGNDIIAVRDIMEQALTRARDGKGTTIVEAKTYRLSDHTTADDARRYRAQEEVDENWAKEPLIRMRKYLVDTGAWDDKKEEAMLADCATRVDEEVKLYKETGKPPVSDMFDYMFANLPEELQAQRQSAIEEADDHG